MGLWRAIKSSASNLLFLSLQHPSSDFFDLPYLVLRNAHEACSLRFSSAREGSRNTVRPNNSPRGTNVRSAVTTVTPRSTWRAMIVSPNRSHQPHDGARDFVFAASSACSDWRTKPGLDAS